MEIPPLLGRLSQPLERARIGAGKSCTLAICPLTELWRVGEREAVQKRPAVQRHRLLESTFRERLLELRHIAADRLRIQRDGIHPQECRIVHGRADRVKELLERMAGSVRWGIRPEQREKPIATATTISRGCKHRQQGQSPPHALSCDRSS